jgi:hypothetical protein
VGFESLEKGCNMGFEKRCNMGFERGRMRRRSSDRIHLAGYWVWLRVRQSVLLLIL